MYTMKPKQLSVKLSSVKLSSVKVECKSPQDKLSFLPERSSRKKGFNKLHIGTQCLKPFCRTYNTTISSWSFIVRCCVQKYEAKMVECKS